MDGADIERATFALVTEGPPWPREDWRLGGGESARWGLLDFALLRGVITWITGKDPIEQRERRRLARESRQNFEKYESAEKEAYETIRRQVTRPHAGETDGPPPGAPSSTGPGSPL
jgi:hypothetical protein